MGRAWSFSSFHRSGNGIVSFWAAASLVPRGEWAFRQRKCALPACQACGLDAPRVLAELRSSPNMSVLPRRNVLFLFPSGEQSGGPCCNCAFRPSKSAPSACPAFGVDAGHVLAELRSSSIVFWGPLGRAPVGDSKWAGCALVGSSERQCAHLWGFRKATRMPMGDSNGHGARRWADPRDRARSCVIYYNILRSHVMYFKVFYCIAW